MAVDLTYAGSLCDGSPNPAWSNRRIFGRRLRKFSLWHRMMLSAVDSPFTSDGEVRLRDLRIAIGVCRTSFGNSDIRKPWVIPCLIWVWVFLWALWPHRKPKQVDGDPLKQNALQRAIAKRSEVFLQYCGDYLQDPEFTIIPPETNSPPPPPRRRGGNPPPEIEHVSELIMRGIAEERAWNMPIGLANYYRVMFLKASGAEVDFTDPKDLEFQRGLPEEFRWPAENN